MHVPVDVTSWEVVQREPDGSTDNVWLGDPSTGLRWLFKPATDSPGTVQGRDWAEWIVAQIAHKLGVPAAAVVMAARDRVPGSLTRHLIDDPRSARQLQPGSVLLSMVIDGYVGHDPEDLRANVRGHTLSNIAVALQDVACPPGVPAGTSSFASFVDYLVLDALVANTDRHPRNWALLVTPGEATRLAPSYDHGSSLGFQLLASQRERWLTDGVERWAERGRATSFEGGRALTLVQMAADGLQMAGPPRKRRWADALGALTPADTEGVVTLAARMSEVERRFASTLIEVNRRRLLHVCTDA